MTCTAPIRAFRSATVNKSGKRGITFDASQAYTDLKLQLPCGKCLGCMKRKAQEWATRITHEAATWENNVFVTLTYNDEHLPADNSLDYEHFRDFMKRLRYYFKQPIRYFHCGEYGETTNRPHYHAILFNINFDDQKKDLDSNVTTSPLLEKIWGKGFVSIAPVTFETASYVASYTTKKATANKKTVNIDLETGESYEIKAPYATMSRRPGIGATWWEKYNQDLEKDYITNKGTKIKPPRFYDNLLEKETPDEYHKRKLNRAKAVLSNPEAHTTQRLLAKNLINESKLSQTRRNKC
jgi:hypothetical protein